jgi:hypothetical protein
MDVCCLFALGAVQVSADGPALANKKFGRPWQDHPTCGLSAGRRLRCQQNSFLFPYSCAIQSVLSRFGLRGMAIEKSGDEGDRTPDLGVANAALSQLSYIPTQIFFLTN